MAVPSGEASPLVCALEVLEGDQVMMVTAGGKVTRLFADEIPSQGRRTQGRRLVELELGDRVVEVTRAYGAAGARRGQPEDSERESRSQLELLEDESHR